MLRRAFLSLFLLALRSARSDRPPPAPESSTLPDEVADLVLDLDLPEVAGLLLDLDSPKPLYEVASFKATFDTSKYPKDRRAIDAGDAFPSLKGNYEVLAPGGHRRYNCIAHSLGIHSRWVNPKTGPSAHPLEPMDKMYRTRSYHRVKGLDYGLHSGVQKVVVYAKVRDSRIAEVTHGALQERDGTWTSKLGQLALIRHRTPQALNGPATGNRWRCIAGA